MTIGLAALLLFTYLEVSLVGVHQYMFITSAKRVSIVNETIIINVMY